MQKSKILFIGLGTMGSHMASHIQKSKKYDLYVYNRTAKIKNKWINDNKAKSYTFDEDVKFDYIISCVKDDFAINEIVKRIVKAKCFLKSTLFIDHSTISLDQVFKLNKTIIAQKFRFLDAPITGGEEGAKKGSLSIMIGSNLSDFNKVKPILQKYSSSIVHMGKVGSGQLSKFTNQILICGILFSISEANIFSKKNNLDQNKLYDVIKNGAAGSWQFTNRYPSINNNKFNFGFSTQLMEKDLRYVLKQAKKNNLNLELTKNVYKRYKKLISTKYKSQDTSSLIKSFQI